MRAKVKHNNKRKKAAVAVRRQVRSRRVVASKSSRRLKPQPAVSKSPDNPGNDFLKKDPHAWVVDLDKKMESDWKEIQKRIGDYFTEGTGMVAKISKELSQRFYLLIVLINQFESKKSEIEKAYPSAISESIEALSNAAWLVNYEMQRLARKGHVQAAEYFWNNATKLTQEVGWLADHKPELLKAKATKTLFMPSLRAHAQKFNDNFVKRAGRIGLGTKGAVKTGNKAAYKLDSMATQFAANLLEQVDFKRKLLQGVQYFFESQSPDAKKSIGPTLDDVLLKVPGIKPQDLKHLSLPPYCKSTAPIWWENHIKPILEDPETLQQMEGSDFYKHLVKAATIPVDYEIHQQLKDECKRQILGSLAPETPQT
jgi:hypothetical protein